MTVIVAATTAVQKLGEHLATKPEIWQQWKNSFPQILDVVSGADAKPKVA